MIISNILTQYTLDSFPLPHWRRDIGSILLKTVPIVSLLILPEEKVVSKVMRSPRQSDVFMFQCQGHAGIHNSMISTFPITMWTYISCL